MNKLLDLEYLNIEDNEHLLELPETFIELKNLKKVNMRATHLPEMPGDPYFSSWPLVEELSLRENGQFEELHRKFTF